MAKPTKAPQTPIPAPVPEASKVDRLAWPNSPKELHCTERSFRIHRENAFEWQAYVLENGVERPIGKPDLFDIVSHKVRAILKAEGQMKYLGDKTKSAQASGSQKPGGADAE